MSSQLPHHWIDTTKVGSNVHAVSLTVEPDMVSAVSAAIGVEGIVLLEAKLDYSAWNARGIKVSGVVEAVVDQRCIVTLEPVQNTLSEHFVQHFLPEADSREASPEIIDGEMVLEPEGDDLPDVFSNNRIDLWAVVLEQLNLAVDLFPRSDNLEMVEEEVCNPQTEDPTHRPFADLKTLITEKNPKKER